MSGHYFFPGLEQEWQHTHECIRLNYAQSLEVVERGIIILASTINELYGSNKNTNKSVSRETKVKIGTNNE